MTQISRNDIEKELIEITRQFLVDSDISFNREIRMDSSLHRHLSIDSLGRAELFQRFEKKFGVTVSDKLLAEADTLNDIAEFLAHAKPGVFVTPKHRVVQTHGKVSHLDPSQSKTLIELLLFYGERSSSKAHIYFQKEDGSEEILTYGELLNRSLRVANSLRDLGVRENETVAIMQPTTFDFFYSFFGTLLAGGIPVPIYPPFRMHMLEAYAKTEARILSNAETRVLITFEQAEKLSRVLQTFVPSLKHVTTVAELLQPQELKKIYHPKANDFAFIQYTSGSTADPKGVLLTHSNLLSNIQAYGKAIKVTPEDIAVSWLPLYHDMGLIGMWLGSLYYGVPLILMTPFSFLNRPERWLWAIHYHRGTLTGGPNFAYELCVRKIEPEKIEGLDLSSLRMAANGAEKVYPRTLNEFAKKFAPYGLKRGTLLPVYGLAESTVALAIPPIGRDFRVDTVERKQFEEHSIAKPSHGPNTLEFVSCGFPMPEHEIRIVDDDNRVLPERHVGSLQFRGPSNMQGYYNNINATQAIYHDGWFDSGDLAYIADGEVFITGRRKDLIIKAGRNIYPAEIEELVGVVKGVRQGCVAAFGALDPHSGTEELIVVAETRERKPIKREVIVENIKDTIATTLDIVPDQVVLVAPHIVPKTSSGKLQRAACKKMYINGKLGKSQIPTWLQMVKLGLVGALNKCKSIFLMLAKSIYTCYVALILLLTFLPMYLLIHFSSRDTAAKSCRTWARLMMALALCPRRVINVEKLTKETPVIYAVNHASYIDSLVTLAIVPIETRFVVKKELFSVPILNSVLRKLDYVAVDRVDLTKGLEDARHIVNALKMGYPILIFPEGTFGYASGLRPFRLGAFKIAVETTVPICPIALKGTRFMLRDDEILMQPKEITVTVGDLVYPTGKEWHDVTQMRNVVRAEIEKHCGESSLDFIAAHTVAPKYKDR